MRKFIGGAVLGLVIGTIATAHASSDLERTADRIARALERIAQAVDHGKSP